MELNRSNQSCNIKCCKTATTCLHVTLSEQRLVKRRGYDSTSTVISVCSYRMP